MRVLLFAAILLLTAPAASADWTSFQGDARNSGHSTDTVALYSDIWWQSRLDGVKGTAADAPDDSPAEISGSVVVAAGIAIIGDWNGRLRAIDTETGTEKWRHTFPGRILATAAIDGTRVLAVDEPGNLKSFELSSGRLLESVAVGKTRGSPTTDEGKLYIGNEAGEMKAYDTQTLTLDWSYKVTEASDFSTTSETSVVTCGPKHATGAIRGAPAVYDGKVFFGALNDHFYAVDADGDPDGKTKLQWFYRAGDDIVSSPTINDARKNVIFASYDGKVYSLLAKQSGEGSNKCTGKSGSAFPAWTHRVDDTDAPRLGSSPATDGAYVFFGSPDNNVYAITASDGKLVWRLPTQGAVTSAPSVSGAYVVVGSGDGNVYWIGAADGIIQASFSAKSPVDSNPAIDGDHAFVTSFDGTVARLGPQMPIYADLVATGATATEAGFFITIQNIGDKAAEATTIELYVNDSLTATIDVPTLEAGGTSTLTHAMTLEPGSHPVKVIVDPSATLKESNEGNNQYETTVEIGAPAAELEKKDEGLPGPGAALLLAGIAVVAGLVRRRR
jgi:outer membrane protein assembly factor BamB